MLSFFAWVITGPRSLDYLTPYIASKLSHISTHATIHIQHSIIQWDPIKKQIVISAQQVEILDSTNDPLATIPEISFELNVLRLLLGNFLSSEITVLHPTFYLTTSHKQIAIRSQKDLAAPRNILDVMHAYLGDQQRTLEITRINLEEATIYIDNGQTNSLWLIKRGFAQTSKSFRKGKRVLHAEFSLQSGNNTPTDCLVTLTETHAQTLDLSIRTNHLSSTMVQDLFPGLSWLSGINVVMDGEMHLLSGKDNTAPHVTFQIQKSTGHLHLPDYFPEEISIKKLELKGGFSFPEQTLTIDSFVFEPDTSPHYPTFSLKGTFKNFLSLFLPQKISPELDFSTRIDTLNVDDIKKYWPLPIRPLLREWITTRITSGQITHAEGIFHITPEDFDLLRQHEETGTEHPEDLKNLPLPPEGMLQASIDIDHANIQYHPKFPTAHNVHARITFDHKRMNIAVDQGTVLNSTIEHATVAMDNMWLKPSYMTVEGAVEGKAEDMIAYLKATLPEKDIQTPALKSIYHLTGLASIQLALGFPILPTPLHYDDIALDLQATATNVIAPNFINNAGIEMGAFDVTLHNRSLKITGKGKIQDIPFTTDFTYNLSPSTQHLISQNHLRATVTADQLRALHLADIPYVFSPFDLDILLTDTPNGTTIKGTADLTKASISYPEYNFTKNSGAHASFIFEGVINKTLLTLSSFILKGDHIDIQGRGTFSDNMITKLHLPVLKFGKTDAQLTYEHTPTGYSLEIFGNALDLGNAPISNVFNQTKAKQSLALKIRLKKLIARNDISFSPLRADINCSPLLCLSIQIHGLMEEKNTLDATLQSVDQRHVLLIESDNAGLLINALGISEHIKNGTLHIKTTAQKDDQDNLITQGVIQIENFNAVKTPLLSKLLTLASLKGFTDILEQQGISFDQFEAPIKISNGIITVTDARTSGSSIGITGDGTINTRTDEINIKGVIVPAQEVNKLISKIPLIGNFIIGGKNQGVIATTYRVEGDYKDAKISVNPFSILTPSFLRKIFTILPD